MTWAPGFPTIWLMSRKLQQMDLFEGSAGLAPQQLLDRLNAAAHRRVTLRLTDNRVSMAWIDFAGTGPIRVSLDEQYLWAPPAVIDALCGYLRSHRRTEWQRVADFARQIPERAKAVRRPRLRSLGRVFDLNALRDEINQTFFGGKVSCRIGWGRGGSPQGRRQRRSIRFGSWQAATHTVRVHPALDRVDVPREFVRYIVYHEMLHAVVPSDTRRGRLYHHTAQFRALERCFPNYPEMKRLGAKLLHEL